MLLLLAIISLLYRGLDWSESGWGGQQLNAKWLSFWAILVSSNAMAAEVWSRFWIWRFGSWRLVKTSRVMFFGILKLNFGQLVIWLKNSYFGESTQSLGQLCLWQCQYQCNDLKRQNTFRNISKNFVLSLQIAFNSKAVMTMSISFCRRGNWGLSTRVTQALDDLVIIFFELFFRCPGQLDR